MFELLRWSQDKTMFLILEKGEGVWQHHVATLHHRHEGFIFSMKPVDVFFAALFEGSTHARPERTIFHSQAAVHSACQEEAIQWHLQQSQAQTHTA